MATTEISAAAAKSRAWRAANPERRRAHQARYRLSHRDDIRASYRAYYAKNKDLFQERSRSRKYGITRTDFDTRLASQSGLCALCAKALPHNRTFIAVDHDHDTGKVRGLLHRGCNNAVGAYENLRKQIEAYLKVYGDN